MKLPMAAAVRVVAPTVNPDVWAGLLAGPMQAADITTPRRAAAFMGQCAEESGGFTVLSENLNYSAERLCVVWPSRFDDDNAPQYAHNPEALANYVYAGRLGNGDESSGDGWTFRGGGLIQLTGRDLYTRFGETVGQSAEDAAAFVRTPAGAIGSACWYWSIRGGLNELADEWRIIEITRRINGGLTNLSTRIQLCNAALQALGETLAQ